MKFLRATQRAVQRVLASIPQIEPVVLVVLAVGTASTWAFIEVADEVIEGETETFDSWLLTALRDPQMPADPWGPRAGWRSWPAMRLLSAAWVDHVLHDCGRRLSRDGRQRADGRVLGWRRDQRAQRSVF